jgi:hypothetical protein
MKSSFLSEIALFRLAVTCGLLIGSSAHADFSNQLAVQVDLGRLLNARGVFTQNNGRLQPADHSLDRGDSSVLITRSATEIRNAGKLNPLPDSGFFAANQQHPDVQLPYGTVGGGPQVHQAAARTEICIIPVPANHYVQMQLFFISAQGPTPIETKLEYADGSSDKRETVVPDFYWLLKDTDKGWFVLAADFGKVNLNGSMTESVHHFIHGFNLDPDPSKILQSVQVVKRDSGSVLNLFGATGQLKTPRPAQAKSFHLGFSASAGKPVSITHPVHFYFAAKDPIDADSVSSHHRHADASDNQHGFQGAR